MGTQPDTCLEVVIDFITRSTELAVDCCKALQQEAPLRRRRSRTGHRIRH